MSPFPRLPRPTRWTWTECAWWTPPRWRGRRCRRPSCGREAGDSAEPARSAITPTGRGATGALLRPQRSLAGARWSVLHPAPARAAPAHGEAHCTTGRGDGALTASTVASTGRPSARRTSRWLQLALADEDHIDRRDQRRRAVRRRLEGDHLMTMTTAPTAAEAPALAHAEAAARRAADRLAAGSCAASTVARSTSRRWPTGARSPTSLTPARPRRGTPSTAVWPSLTPAAPRTSACAPSWTAPRSMTGTPPWPPCAGKPVPPSVRAERALAHKTAERFVGAVEDPDGRDLRRAGLGTGASSAQVGRARLGRAG